MNGTGERFYRLDFLVLFLATPATDGSRKKNGRVMVYPVGIPMGKRVANWNQSQNQFSREPSWFSFQSNLSGRNQVGFAKPGLYLNDPINPLRRRGGPATAGGGLASSSLELRYMTLDRKSPGIFLLLFPLSSFFFLYWTLVIFARLPPKGSLMG